MACHLVRSNPSFRCSSSGIRVPRLIAHRKWTGSMADLLHLLARWRDGDQQAATDLYQRYADRLIALARNYLSAKVAPRLDAEDVVQSVVRSFFHRARAGRFAVDQSDELWRLLVAITLH